MTAQSCGSASQHLLPEFRLAIPATKLGVHFPISLDDRKERGEITSIRQTDPDQIREMNHT